MYVLPVSFLIDWLMKGLIDWYYWLIDCLINYLKSTQQNRHSSKSIITRKKASKQMFSYENHLFSTSQQAARHTNWSRLESTHCLTVTTITTKLWEMRLWRNVVFFLNYNYGRRHHKESRSLYIIFTHDDLTSQVQNTKHTAHTGKPCDSFTTWTENIQFIHTNKWGLHMIIIITFF